MVADNRDPLQKRLEADEMQAEVKEAEERALMRLKARDAGIQRGKGLYNLLKGELPEEVHEALVDGMIHSLQLQRKEAEKKKRALLPKKTFRVYANQPFWCQVEAVDEDEAKELAVAARAWECCWENNDPGEDDIYDVQEIKEEEENA